MLALHVGTYAKNGGRGLVPVMVADDGGMTAGEPFAGAANASFGAHGHGLVYLVDEREEGAVTLLRPAGEVVYVIQDGVAHQRIVKTGVRQSGMVEITEGLKAGEVVAVDGAAFLTDQAKVTAHPDQASSEVSGNTVDQHDAS